MYHDIIFLEGIILTYERTLHAGGIWLQNTVPNYPCEAQNGSLLRLARAPIMNGPFHLPGPPVEGVGGQGAVIGRYIINVSTVALTPGDTCQIRPEATVTCYMFHGQFLLLFFLRKFKCSHAISHTHTHTHTHVFQLVSMMRAECSRLALY